MSTPESTPGRYAIEAMSEINKSLEFKKPIGIPKRRQKQKILDEDTYVEELGKIIQRDFFPDLEKLKAQNEYLEATANNDVVKLRELYAKYSGNKQIERLPSPATFETPPNLHNSQNKPKHNLKNVSETSKSLSEDPKLSLDQFLNTHTSQDNESFEELMIESDRKHKLKYSYLYNEEEKSEIDMKNQLALPSIEEQAALPEKKLNVDTWSYKNKNSIMYVPDGVDLTKEEELKVLKNRQEINYNNTRLKSNPFNDSQSKEVICELAKTQAKVLDGKIGVDGKELITNSPKLGGYSFLRSPSPCPGVAESPLMTWGEIEGTPFRLDGGDTPLPRTQGPSFKISEPPRREQIALALAEKVGVRHRNEKKKAIDVARRQLSSPSPRISTSERLATMSPAAQKLASSRLKLNYSPMTPRGKTLKTPRTPGRVLTPKLSLGIKKPDDLTDDLLKIELPKRQRAADFF
nr:protein DGCR14 homolog [Onthophagus taurus]XP_022906457.1 protein DGCR14 homolog [Onthophagus taurus]